jgi:two-component system, chemotaxis family, chemotaxis protein CheY
MISLDDELAGEYLAESRDHLDTMETDLLALERGGAETTDERVNRVFRAVHSIKGGAGFFDLVKIRELAHKTEDLLALIRSHDLVPTPGRVQVLLRATDLLNELVQNPGTSNQADIAEVLAALASQQVDQPASPAESCDSGVGQGRPSDRPLRILLAEDDFASRFLLQTFLSGYGECHVAVNGKEAVEACRFVLQRGQKYDLICMDIMMPEMDGREAVRQVRAMEEAQGISSTCGAKIIMTTAVHDIKEVVRCFQELCDSYLMKPIDLDQLLGQMRSYKLIQ